MSTEHPTKAEYEDALTGLARIDDGLRRTQDAAMRVVLQAQRAVCEAIINRYREEVLAGEHDGVPVDEVPE